MRAITALWGAVAWIAACPAVAETIRVPEDYATVSGGIGAAVAGDSVLIAIGEFVESPTINVGVLPGVVVKGSGWESFSNSTILSNIRLSFSPGSEPAVVEDLWVYDRTVTFENPNAVIRHCRFGNGGWWSDGVGIQINSAATIERCFFQAQFPHGLNTCIKVYGGSTVRIINNVFDTMSGYVISMPAQNSVETLELRDNTFHEILDLGIDLRPIPSAHVSIVNNIFAPGPTTLRCSAGTDIRYNVFKGTVNFGNCHPLDATNLLVDPLMCDAHWLADFDGFSLNGNSPCIGAGEGGSTIGALGIGCGVTAVGDVSAPGAEKVRLEVVPNPGRNFGTLRLSKPIEGPVEIGCWDATGRLIAKRSVGAIIGREMNLQEVFGDLPVNPESGVYFFELSSDGGRAVAKSLIVR